MRKTPEKIIRLLKANEKLTMNELAETIGRSESAVIRTIKKTERTE